MYQFEEKQRSSTFMFRLTTFMNITNLLNSKRSILSEFFFVSRIVKWCNYCVHVVPQEMFSLYNRLHSCRSKTAKIVRQNRFLIDLQMC